MFKTDKVVFKKLNKMPITRRIEVASSPQGSSVLAALTPTQFAELFPRHYQRGLPDVGGFRAATTAAAQKRQSEASASILDRLTKAEQGAEAYASQIYHKLKRKLGLEVEKQPELSREADEALTKLRSGPIAVSSNEGKIFSRLDDKKLESVGIKRTKDDTGRDVYQYAPPEAGREEAIGRLASSSAKGLKGSVYNAFTNAGFSSNQAKALTAEVGRENDFREQYVFGSHKDAANRLSNLGFFSWQGNRNTQLYERLKSKGLVDANGNIIKSQESLNEMARFTKYEMESNPSYKRTKEQFLNNPNISKQQAAEVLGNDYIRWDMAGNTLGKSGAAAASNKRNMYYDSIGGGEPFTPKGPNGTYTEEQNKQIEQMMDQLRDEKNAARKQQLANLLSDAGVNTATINSISRVETSGVSGQHFGKGKECVALSKHFAPQIGPASKWQFNEGTSGIVPGAVIATRSYGHGPTPGGARFDQMPDKKSHYHTGIALTRPNERGEVLIFDQARGYGSKITKVNVNDYHGETWGVVKGGEPTPRSMEAVNIALSRANESEKAAITESMRGATPKTATSTGKLEAVVDTGPPPVKPVDQEGNPIPPQQQAPMQQPGEPQQPAPQVKADAPPPAPKIQPVRYKFDEAAFESSVRAKYGMLAGMYDRAGLVAEFKSKLPEGVTYEKGILTIKDPNSPHIKTIRQDMEKEFGREAIDRMITQVKEEKKPEPPKPQAPPPETKPKEQTPVAPPPEQTQTEPATIKKFVKGDGYAGMVDVPNPKYVAPKQETPAPKVEAKPQEPPKVPGASDGGSFDLAISPMDKRDNKAVIDTKTQQPLFTVKSGERINVTPQQKVDGIAPAQDNIRNEINTLRQEISSSFADAGGKMTSMQMTPIRSAGTDNPNFVDRLTKQNVDLWNNPVMERAMNRTRLQETGDSLNNHFSYGNTNG